MKSAMYRTERPYRFGFSARCWLIIGVGFFILCGCRTPAGEVPKGLAKMSQVSSPITQPQQTDISQSLKRLPPVDAVSETEPSVQTASFTSPSDRGVKMSIGDQPSSTSEPPVPRAPSGVSQPIAQPYGMPYVSERVHIHTVEPSVWGRGQTLPVSAWGGEPSQWVPDDEYLFDGGDRHNAVQVAADGSLAGLDVEDTVAYFRTANGTVHTVPSNPVYVYAPRFAAIRQVSGVLLASGRDDSLSLRQPTEVISQERREGADLAWMADFAEGNTNVEALYSFRRRDLALGLHHERFLHGLVRELLPYENLNYVRHGSYDNSEKARLASAITAAKVWAHDVALQVVIDGQVAHEAAAGNSADVTTRFEMPKGKPRLRLAKLASRQDANPGDTVDFTIRFDNIGDQPLESLTLVDRLTPRLELVPDSVSSSLDAQFSTQENDDGGTTLRWTFTGGLRVGEGGTVQFRCVVR